MVEVPQELHYPLELVALKSVALAGGLSLKLPLIAISQFHTRAREHGCLSHGGIPGHKIAVPSRLVDPNNQNYAEANRQRCL